MNENAAAQMVYPFVPFVRNRRQGVSVSPGEICIVFLCQ